MRPLPRKPRASLTGKKNARRWRAIRTRRASCNAAVLIDDGSRVAKLIACLCEGEVVANLTAKLSIAWNQRQAWPALVVLIVAHAAFNLFLNPIGADGDPNSINTGGFGRGVFRQLHQAVELFYAQYIRARRA